MSGGIVGTLKLSLPSSAKVGDTIKGWLYFTSSAFESSGPLAVDVVGLARVGWAVSPADPLFVAVGTPDGRVDQESEFWRQRIDVAPPQEFTAGEHAYQFEFPLPSAMTSMFHHTDPYSGELIATRYVVEAALIDEFNIVTPTSSPLAIVQTGIPFSSLSPVKAAQTSSKLSLKIHARRDHFTAGQTATVFIDAHNANPVTRVRILAVELIQRLNLWTYSVVTPGVPLTTSSTRVVARVDLPPLAPGDNHASTLKLPVPPHLPPSVSVDGLDVSYELTVVGILGGTDQGGGTELRTGSEVFIVGPDTVVEVPTEPGYPGFQGDWDEVNEERLMTQSAVDAAVAEIKKMALETEAEYQARVQAAQEAAQRALAEADQAVRANQEETAAILLKHREEQDRIIKQKEQEAAELLKRKEEEAERLLKLKEEEAAAIIRENAEKAERAEQLLREKEEAAARLVKQKEEETARLLKESEEAAARKAKEQEELTTRLLKEREELAARQVQEQKEEAERKILEAQEAAKEQARILKLNAEETAKRVKAAEEAAAAAAAVAAAVRKSNYEAMSKKPPLPPRTGIEGKILESTGLVGKATVLQVDITYKDSALYQLFKLYYFDLTSDEDRRLREENKVPGVLVYANAAASLRISKEEVPTWLKWQRKEESRSKVSGEQQEYAAKLNLGPGRYYIAVFGNANPLVMTSFTITIRHLPLTLNMQDFDHFWSRMHLKDPIPKNALYAGHDIDSHSLYVVRVRLPDGSVHIGYTSPAMKAPVVSYSTGSPPAWKPFQVNTDFDILTQAPGLRFVEQLQAGIPYNAVPAGQEADGRVLYVVRATVQGKSVNLLKNSLLPGEGGLHRNGATVVAKGGLGILVAPFEVAKGLVPFEILVYQNPTNKSFTPPK